jgi:hypothetical protein
VLLTLIIEIGAATSFRLKNKLTAFHWIFYTSFGVLSKVDVYTDVSCIVLASECDSIWFAPMVSLFGIGCLLGQCGPGCASAVFFCHLRYVDEDSDYCTIYKWLDFHLLSELFRSEAGANFKEQILLMYGASFCYSLWKLGQFVCQFMFLLTVFDAAGVGEADNDSALTVLVSLTTSVTVVGYCLSKVR